MVSLRGASVVFGLEDWVAPASGRANAGLKPGATMGSSESEVKVEGLRLKVEGAKRRDQPESHAEAPACRGETKEAIMALIERGEPSPEQVRANRANAQKSTGPRTARGKRMVAQNSSKRGLLTDLFTESMHDLGEDPAAFRILHGGFVDSLRPANLLEEALVADLAKAWWKKARAERAQSAYQVHEIEKLERQHRQKLLGMDPEDRAGEEVIAGTTRISKSCATNYHQVIGPLMYLLETVDKGDWLEEPRDLLARIYGEFPTPRGVLIKQMFAEWLRAEEKLDDARRRRVAPNFSSAHANAHLKVGATDEALADVAPTGTFPGEDWKPAPAENSMGDDLDFQQLLGQDPVFAASDDPNGPASPHPAEQDEQELRTALKRLLLEEIHEVTREYELYQTALAPLTPAARLARVAPCGEWQGGRGNAWPLMLRQDASLARQFDRSLRLLLALRGTKPGNPSVDGRRRSPGTSGPQGGNGNQRIEEHGKSKGKGQKAKGKNQPTKRTNSRLSAGFPAAGKSAATAHSKGARSAKSEKQSRYVYENTGAAEKKPIVRLKRRPSPGARVSAASLREKGFALPRSVS